MMHYRKGENVEKEITKDDLPFKDCVSEGINFLWMHVKGGTKVHNVIDYAKNALDKGEHTIIIWSGQGGGVIKTVSCAEILKRYYELYQVTRTNYVKVEEHWLPQMNGLEEIIVTRQIPSIHILQSLTKIDENIPDVQQPNVKTEFWPNNIGQSGGSSNGSDGLPSANQQQYRGKPQQQERQQKQKRQWQQQQRQKQQKQEQQLQDQIKQCHVGTGEGVVTRDDAAVAISSSSNQLTNRQVRKAKRKRTSQDQGQASSQNNSSVKSSTSTANKKNNKNQHQEQIITNKTKS